MGAILTFPQSMQAAWDIYAKMIQERADDPTLLANFAHSCATARAWDRWRDLFLAEKSEL
jgi:hypothetical protein